MSNVDDIARISLKNARLCLEAKNYGRSFANFLLFLKLKPENSSQVYMEFALASEKWFEKLENEQRLGDLFKGYDQACEFFQNHEMVLNNIGAQLFRLGYPQEAAAYIRKSLMVNPDYLAARSNLENICCHLVERWHFSMLNDRRRNVAYRFAIQKAIKSGYNTVLDIGTGTGILSLVCEKAGAVQVTACDDSRAMIDVARDVLAANGCQGKITLHNKHSTSLQIPGDMAERVKLMVTETFDAGLFGEHIVSTLIHAWKSLISTTPTGTVIPCGATVYMCGIECDTIRNKSRLLYPVLQHLDLSHVQLVCATGHVAEEPYTTENLAKIRGGYKILTNITELLRELESLHKGKDWFSDLYVKKSGRLDAIAVWFDLHLDDTITIATGADTESCWEQAIYPIPSLHRRNPSDHNFHVRKKDSLRTCFHFQQDCLRLIKCELIQQLSPFDSYIQKQPTDNVTTETGSGTSVSECSKKCLPFRKRKVEDNMCRGDMSDDFEQTDCCCEQITDNTGINQTECDTQTVTTELTNKTDPESNIGEPIHNSDQTEGTMDTEILPDPPDVGIEAGSLCDSLNSLKSIDNSDISSPCLTDENVHIFMDKCCIGSVSEGLSVKPRENIEKLTFVTEHADIEYVNDIELNRQYCSVLESYLRQYKGEKLSLLYVSHRLSFLGIQAAKMGYCSVTIATAEEHHETLVKVAAINSCKQGTVTVLDLGDINDIERKFDVIISDIVEPCGALRQQSLEDLVYHRVTSLTDRGILLPQKIKIQGLLISSDELENLSHVTGDDKTLGFHIADFINLFQMQHHLNIDLTTLSYTKLSDVNELISLDFSELTLDSGPDVLDLKVERSMEVTSPGKVTALIYWFELALGKDIIVSTLDARCHWAQAGIMVRDDISVSQGQVLLTKVMLQNSCLDVKIVQPECSNGRH